MRLGFAYCMLKFCERRFSISFQVDRLLLISTEKRKLALLFKLLLLFEARFIIIIQNSAREHAQRLNKRQQIDNKVVYMDMYIS
jgi:hypothetical protein